MEKLGYFGAVRGYSGSSAMSPFDFNRNCASILYRFRDIASYLSKVADFNPLHLHSTQIFGTRKLHRESKKTRHQTLGHNFTNYYPIFNFFFH